MPDNEGMRRILHIDVDAFFAAVEQRDNPSLRGLPVAVGGSSSRGVLTTASYEARRFGVGSAMPTWKALELCPDLIVVPGRFPVYREISEQMREIFRRFTDYVEPVSIDEAYLDVTEPLRGPPSGTIIAQRIRRAVWEETQLTVTAGVSYCKFLAKLASGMNKPNGLTVITPVDAPRILATLPVERIPGVGPRMQERLRNVGIVTAGDVAEKFTEREMIDRFGKAGHRLYWLAQGVDDRPVEPDQARKSVSSETTFQTDIHDVDELAAELPALAEDVAKRLARAGIGGKGVTVKVKYADHAILTRQYLLPGTVRTAREILPIAERILRERIPFKKPIRLLGVGVYGLAEHEEPVPLFPDWLKSFE